MILTQAQCTNCSANLPVDSTKDAAICSFCGSAFIVEKAIQNYNVAHAQISAGVVNIIKEPAPDFVIRGGFLMEYNAQEFDVVIPDTVLDIGVDVFADRAIRSIIIPKTVKKLSAKMPDTLEKIVLPEGLQVIDNNVFCGCRLLKNIELPHSLQVIGNFAFQNCISLEGVDLPKSLVSIGDSAFKGCSNIKRAHLPTGTTFSGWEAFWHCDKLEDVKSRYLQQFLSTPWGNKIEGELNSYLIGIIDARVRKKLCVYCGGKVNKRAVIMHGERCNTCKSCGVGYPNYNLHTEQLKRQPLQNKDIHPVLIQPENYSHFVGYRTFAGLAVDFLAKRDMQW